ncbi:hypothetical protein [Bradyrhizobium sp. dw_411]|uniref:hypothetical protein n=1 Tax=Bradyrhizobium sp. dw_411 TaxID=2720082 RepID=UPI001BCF5EDA|nr:hypothetical protein [Bradyrhizobium sp. dw_411]
MTESGSEKTVASTHLERFGIWLAIVLPVLSCAEALRWAFVWGQRGDPVLHYWIAAVASIAIALLFYAFELIVARYPDVAWLARLHVPRWTALEPFFKSTKIPLTIVFLSYALFYVTQGVDEETRWAIWVNRHVFNFDLFCRHFSAIDTIRIEIAGYALYLTLHVIYNYFCPPILAHAIRKSGGLAREDAALVLVRTIERHGQAVPQSDLAKTIYGFADENRGLLDEESRKVLDERLKLLDGYANPHPTDEPLQGEADAEVGAASPAVAMAAAGDAAAVARLFPSERATETYYLGVDLFDILYPPVRVLLCAGLVAAILATSLPVAAKLLWVAFPRLGEACMTDLNQVPVDFRDSEWVEFEGSVQTTGPDTSVLVPADDANERWTLENKNVTVNKGEREQRIFLRIGTVVEIDTMGMGASTAPPYSPAPNARMSKQCSSGSRCSNHVEICCGSNEIKGKCYGRWPCPKQP